MPVQRQQHVPGGHALPAVQGPALVVFELVEGALPLGVLLWLQKGQELLQRQLQIAPKSVCGGHVFRELRAVDIYMHYLRLSGELLTVAGYPVVEAHP